MSGRGFGDTLRSPPSGIRGPIAAVLTAINACKDTGLFTVRMASRTLQDGGLAADVSIPPLLLPAILRVPAPPRGLVIFAHGSGSSRLSPRNAFVAEALNEAGFATLLFDLLAGGEEADRQNVFDIPLLADRLAGAVEWRSEQAPLADLPLGLFGASTGAAAALVAAARLGNTVNAVVSRGGRPDLAGRALDVVQASTLLIVGGNDPEVLSLNEAALARLNCPKALKVVPHATHLFSEPGTMDRVIIEATDWFGKYLNRTAAKG